MNISKVIPIGCDHAGYELKERVKIFLNNLGYEVKDFGTYSNESSDYPDYAHAVATHVENDKNALGILICGSGNGISMTANKHQGVRCALCWLPEIAELSRLHNDANIISIPARFVSEDLAEKMIEKFISTAFEGGRHANRVNKIACV